MKVTDEMVELAARQVALRSGPWRRNEEDEKARIDELWMGYEPEARAALKAVLPLIRDAALEGGEAARLKITNQYLRGVIEALEELLASANARNKVLEKALSGILNLYTSLANSGDAGFWDCEGEDEVLAARAALGGK